MTSRSSTATNRATPSAASSNFSATLGSAYRSIKGAILWIIVWTEAMKRIALTTSKSVAELVEVHGFDKQTT